MIRLAHQHTSRLMSVAAFAIATNYLLEIATDSHTAQKRRLNQLWSPLVPRAYRRCISVSVTDTPPPPLSPPFEVADRGQKRRRGASDSASSRARGGVVGGYVDKKTLCTPRARVRSCPVGHTRSAFAGVHWRALPAVTDGKQHIL